VLLANSLAKREKYNMILLEIHKEGFNKTKKY
jgi:hypothetical protein